MDCDCLIIAIIMYHSHTTALCLLPWTRELLTGYPDDYKMYYMTFAVSHNRTDFLQLRPSHPTTVTATVFLNCCENFCPNIYIYIYMLEILRSCENKGLVCDNRCLVCSFFSSSQWHINSNSQIGNTTYEHHDVFLFPDGAGGYQ